MELPAPTRADQLKSLTQTGPDSSMGKLLRKFWHPVALSSDVAPGKAAPVRVLSEDLTLYRGESGKIHLVGGRCAHRCTVLHTGWIEGDDLRCMYHGWRFDASGACVEIPAEGKPRAKMPRIVSYPTHEYCGLVFAWLGEAPAPAFDLPRKEVFEKPGLTIFAKRETWDCSWFQQIENSMDALHLNFAHKWGVRGAFGARITGGGAGVLPQLDYHETQSGLRQIATRSKDNVRVSDWTFPNNNHVVAPGPNPDDPWVHISAWQTPMDDAHTHRFTIYAMEVSDESRVEKLREGFDLDYDPSQFRDRLFRGDVGTVNEPGLISIQDYVAIVGQGAIADRGAENLSTSDKGIALLRLVFLRELDLIQRGMPTKNWARLKDEPHLKAPPPIAAE